MRTRNDLSAKVAELAKKVEELEKRMGGRVVSPLLHH